MPDYLPPGVQRLTDRLADTPVAVFTAAWTIVQWNDMWAALQGDPSAWCGRDRNLVWRHFIGAAGSRVVHDGADVIAYEREIVADLRLATARYRDDPDLTALIVDLSARSPRFAELWGRFEVGPRVSAHKTVEHPDVGPIALDCEVLAVAGSDLKMVVYTAEPHTPDAANLELLGILGVQHLADGDRRTGTGEETVGKADHRTDADGALSSRPSGGSAYPNERSEKVPSATSIPPGSAR